MAEADLVIRGGTIVDGTGSKPFVGDIAITGAKISDVGHRLPVRGKREYDASGLVVAPGWVDAHTHFDGQVTWDPYLTPSSAGGVTTIVMGNCGVGFAPCQVERRDALVQLVEAIEDVPGTAVHEGMRWEWETFEDYMNALSRKVFACDCCAMISHSALRNWILGDRMNYGDRPGGRLNAPVGKNEVERMAAVVRDAVAAGAMGFSTSRAIYHRDMSGVLMPGSLAEPEEMLALLRAIGEGGGGVFAANMDFASYDDVQSHEQGKMKAHWKQEWAWLNTIASESPGKINMTFEVTGDPGVVERLKKVEAMMGLYGSKGLLMRTQIHARPQGFLQAANSKLNFLVLSKIYRRLDKADPTKLLAQLQDASMRSKILEEAEDTLKRCLQAMKEGKQHSFSGLVSTIGPFSKVFPWTPGCEPAPEDSIEALAKSKGATYLEAYYDHLVPPHGKELGVCWKPLNNYAENNHDRMHKVFDHPFTIPGVSDAGAHSGVFNDANGPTHLLTHWVRDRTRGPRFPIEFMVRKQTSEIAKLFGLHDRGEIRAGMKADINVIDMGKLELLKPFVADDLPTRATRWMQHVTGYRMTLVSGEETYRDGKPTGSLPGVFTRNPKADATQWRGVSHAVAWRESSAETAAASLDMKDIALQAAQGGGASAIGRIARDLDENKEPGNARSRL